MLSSSIDTKESDEFLMIPSALVNVSMNSIVNYCSLRVRSNGLYLDGLRSLMIWMLDSKTKVSSSS